jgi:DNA-binding response OmpR family regulator
MAVRKPAFAVEGSSVMPSCCAALAKNSSKVFSRENLLDSIWGYDYFGDSRTVDSHIKRLRAKVDKFEHEEWEIKTIWGVGYRFEEKEHAQ